MVDVPTRVGSACIPPAAPGRPPAPGQAAAPRIITITVTASDFQKLTLRDRTSYCSCVPNEHNKPMALVHRPQAYWTDGTTETLTTVMLGQIVQIRATPVSWTFNFGNGTSATSSGPGVKYTLNPIKHPPKTVKGTIWNVYHHKGTYHVTQTITYTAEYSVNLGPWQPITGTLTRPGQSMTLEARAYTALLVDEDY
ncbi:hypothetical protein JT358_05880 [Micrococcales bacterium 31B]|nr:hypothetical protein [Micrococcales bacterium 31B]